MKSSYGLHQCSDQRSHRNALGLIVYTLAAAVCLSGGTIEPLGIAGIKTAHAAEELPSNDSRISYNAQIRPIFQVNCIRCHGDYLPQSRYVMTSYNRLIAGGAKGSDIVSGNPAKSLLIEYISGTPARMPPAGEGSQLTRREIDLIRRWVKEGALDDTPMNDVDSKSELKFPINGVGRFHLARGKVRYLEERFPGSRKELWATLSNVPLPAGTVLILKNHGQPLGKIILNGRRDGSLKLMTTLHQRVPVFNPSSHITIETIDGQLVLR